MVVRYWLTFCDAAVEPELGVGVGDDIIGVMHPEGHPEEQPQVPRSLTSLLGVVCS
ncbi:MAG: hypothetical protein ACXV5N_10645 [Halobacteriota archaeon]